MSDELECPIHQWAKLYSGITSSVIPPVPYALREPDCRRCSICDLALSYQQLSKQRQWALADAAYAELSKQVWNAYGRETMQKGPRGRPRKPK